MKHFEAELPQGYVEVKTVDAKTKKFSVIMTLGSLLLTVAVFAIGFGIIYVTTEDYHFPTDEGMFKSLLQLAVFGGVMIAYIVLHELVHGIVYKLFTKQKLTFGLTLTVAYCGVPNIYVYRTAALCALLAPFLVFDVVFLVPTILLSEGWQLVCLALFAFHFGGCIGDLYDTALYTFVFRDKTTLMRDTGPKQTFYLSQNSKNYAKLLQNGKIAASESTQDNSTNKDN